MKNISQIIREAQLKHAARIQLLHNNAADLEDIAKQLELAKVNVVSFELDDDNDFFIEVAGDRIAFQKVWAILRCVGYTPERQPSNELHASLHTHFYKTHAVPIWFSFTSVNCKLVKTGVKMVEQTIYEVRCSGADSPEAEKAK